VKYLRWIIVIALALILGAFAIHNHQAVTLDLWPLPFAEVKVAAFILVMAAAFVGFILGGLIAWIGGAASRRAAREKARALATTRRELEATRQRLPAPSARA
jgi:uncharacterized integral membrane protein